MDTTLGILFAITAMTNRSCGTDEKSLATLKILNNRRIKMLPMIVVGKADKTTTNKSNRFHFEQKNSLRNTRIFKHISAIKNNKHILSIAIRIELFVKNENVNAPKIIESKMIMPSTKP